MEGLGKDFNVVPIAAGVGPERCATRAGVTFICTGNDTFTITVLRHLRRFVRHPRQHHHQEDHQHGDQRHRRVGHRHAVRVERRHHRVRLGRVLRVRRLTPRRQVVRQGFCVGASGLVTATSTHLTSCSARPTTSPSWGPDMSTLIAADQIRSLLVGIKVQRATAALPQTAAGSLFTIAGGKVLITSLVGEVTTVIQTQADNTKLTFDPTDAGATQDLCAVLDITADAVGTMYSLTGTPATALQDALNFLPSSKVPAQPIVLKPGAILLDGRGVEHRQREVGSDVHPARQRRVCDGGLTWRRGSARSAPPPSRWALRAARTAGARRTPSRE
jgi:hypothetical protein